VAAVNLALTVGVAVFAPSQSGLARRGFGALCALVGFTLPLGVAAAFLYGQGTLGDLWHWAVVRLVSHYGPSVWRPAPMIEGFLSRFLPFCAATIVLWVCVAPLLRRYAKLSQGMRIAMGWFGVSLAGSMAGGHFFGHYFIQLVGPMSLLAAIQIDRLLGAPRSTKRTAAIAGLATFTVIPAVGFAIVATLLEPVTERFGRPQPDYPALANYVRERTSESDRVFIWGMSPTIYAASTRLPATRFVGFLRGLAREKGEDPEKAWDTGPDVWPLLAQDFEAHPPAMILDTSTANYFHFAAYPMARFPALDALVQSGYVRETNMFGVDIYKRRPPETRAFGRAHPTR
jgi:hypothetical protein